MVAEIKPGARVLLNDVGIGVVLREAIHPQHSNDQGFSVFEVEMHEPGRWFGKPRKIWRKADDLRLIQ